MSDQRKARLEAVAERFDMDMGRAYSGPEDFAELLKEPTQWIAVTRGGSDGELIYIVGADSKEDAEQRAGAHIQDDIYPELPVAVVDLDTGDMHHVEITISFPVLQPGAIEVPS